MRQLRPAATDASPVREILSRLEDLAPVFRDSAAEADRLARLPKQVVHALVRGGLFRLWVPKKCAGFELDLDEALQVLEAAARLDGSVGWAVMIGASGGLNAAHFDTATATSIFARPEAVLASSASPDGRAVRVDGGYKVTGCWHYATGAHYATTFAANCIVMEGGALVFGTDGRPLIRTVALDAPLVSILPAWDPVGLRGTGSDDFEVRDVFVPEQRTFPVAADTPRETGALYRLPIAVLTELSVLAVALGITRHTLDAFTVLARRKKIPYLGAPLGDDPGVQARFAESYGTWRLAKSGMNSLVAQVWEAARTSKALSPGELSEVTAVITVSIAKLRAVIGELMSYTGMTAIQQEDDLARTWRDLQALAAHISVSPRNLTTSGATLLAR
jgi:alkylation response protein AidB-like acyl-CoA dehydrogenase